MPKHSTILQVHELLHPSRMGIYNVRCNNDPRKALEVYRWNVQLGSAFQEVLAITEVILRNALDAELRRWNSTQPTTSGGNYSAEWLISAARPLNAMMKNAAKTAHKHAEEAEADRDPGHARKGAAITHDDLLAQLTFGTWPKLLPQPGTDPAETTRRNILWNQALHNAFPHESNPKIIADRVRRLHKLRNRVAHMEPLLDLNVTARHRDALRLLGAISPAARDWCAGFSRVPEIARQRPI
ncbi:hypothetical protein [Gordonia rhizosphera]|uniref:hypothetical protein n=1 Tax=Gordonia rhizosphera TaxID=83341 RepID=UPI00058F8DC8|nr:hypothetical protein [Gordonia rhizosphera]